MSECNLQFQQNITGTIHDLKMQVGQLADTVSQMQSVDFGNIPSQTIPNLKGGVGISSAGLAETESEPRADSQVQQLVRSVPLPFPNRTISTKRSEIEEDLLKLFKKVEINIPLLNAIKQIPKYAKYLKELYVQNRKKMKGAAEKGGVMSTLVQNEDTVLEFNCQDPGIFVVPCTIRNYTSTNAMLDLEASINVMPASVYKSLNFRDLELTRMEIQLANKSVAQPLGILEDVLV
ncbi:hypothetical protein CR513_51967, partial [Mucuna pruriens]